MNTEPNSRAEQRKQYMRKYIRKWRQQNPRKRATLYFSPQEYARIQKQAMVHKMKPAQYIKVVYHAYHDEKLILPPDVKDGFLEMLYLLRNATNNLNQQTRYLHQQNLNRGSFFGRGSSQILDPKDIQKQVMDLEKPIANFLKKFT
jgi:hypothetical protein